ncbi:MAG: GTPase, partial [Nitrospirota bacterium]
MKIAITGLSNSGKTTVFNALTGQNIETTIYPTT